MTNIPSGVILKEGVIICDVSYRYLDETQWIDGGNRAIPIDLIIALRGEILEVGESFMDHCEKVNQETHYTRIK